MGRWHTHLLLHEHSRNPRESGDPVNRASAAEYWIPAFAGISNGVPLNQHASIGGRS